MLKRQSCWWPSCRIWSQTRVYLVQCLSSPQFDFVPSIGIWGLVGTKADPGRTFLPPHIIPDQPSLNFWWAAPVGPARLGRPVSSWFGRRAAMCLDNMSTIVASQYDFGCNDCFVIEVVWRSFTGEPVARIQTLDNFTLLARLSRMMESARFVCGILLHQTPKRFGRMVWCSRRLGPRVARCWGTCRRMMCAFPRFPMCKLWMPQLVIKSWSA